MTPRFPRLILSLSLGCPLVPAAVPALLWSDDFNQPIDTAPDPARWAYDLGAGGWGNNELQTYTNSRENSFVIADPTALDGRALALRAIRSSAGAYTSTRLKTQGKFSVTYGRIEARVKLTRGRGVWPAFWMLGDSIATLGWPACGEIDVMEHLGHDPGRVYGTIHGPGYAGASGPGSSTVLPGGTALSDDYHVFAIDWSPNKIEWSLDGTVYFSRTAAQLPAGTKWVFDAPAFLLLNLAVGGNWPGNPDATTVFPQTLLVDYVRVYGLPPASPASLGGYAPAPGAVRLSWTASPLTHGYAVTGYRLERATDRAFTQNRFSRDLGPATSFTETTLPASTVFFYRLSALTAGGVSDASEILQVQPAAAVTGGTARMINLSTRATVASGTGVTIAGFVVAGDAPKQILLRGIGPALAGFGVDGTLADPSIALLDARGALLATNDNWSDNADAPEIARASASVGAFALATGSKDAALLATLSPGAYTATLTGAAASSGVALIEVYEVP